MPANNKRIAKRARPDRAAPKSRSNWKAVDSASDADIDAQIAADPHVAPIFSDEMLANAMLVIPAKKQPISFRVDPDVIEFFKSQGPGYQSRMNRVLRAYMEKFQAAREKPSSAASKPSRRVAESGRPRRK